jgi:spore coat protein U-like protein
MKQSWIYGLFFFLFGLLPCHPALGAITCNFSVTDANFGSVNLLSGAAVDTTLRINYTCNATLAITTRLCFNINAGGGGQSGGTRQMLNGSNVLKYQLYQDSARTIPWGSATDTSLGTPVSVDFLLPLLGVSGFKDVYARILPNQQSTAGGAYSSIFSGGQARFNYDGYLLIPPTCAALTQNPSLPSFTVQANVDRTCNVSAETINFGNHGILNTQIDARSKLSVTCTLNLPYSIALSGGSSNAPPTARKMMKNSESVTYGLYLDNARQQPWGSGAGQIASGTGAGAAQDYFVYGRVAPQATPSPGDYSDTVAVTVTY